MKPSITLLLLALGLLSGCKMSDIRTPAMKTAIDAPDSAEKAQQLLQLMATAHQLDKWGNYQTVSFELSDEFMRLKIASPHPGVNARLQLDYIPLSYDGRMTRLDGKTKGEKWGLSDFHSWKQKAGAERVWKHNKNIKFWLPTYQYFIQLPLKIREASLLRHGGKCKVGDIEYDIVFASWNTDEPQKDLDQYALYLNPETHLVDIVEFTVRGALSWIRGACFYENYHEVEGLKVPGVMTVLGPRVDFEDRKVFHRMEVLGTQFDKVGVEELSLEIPKK